jgi:hypothetical protein
MSIDKRKIKTQDELDEPAPIQAQEADRELEKARKGKS